MKRLFSTTIVLFLLLTLGFLVRWYHLDEKSMVTDEQWTLRFTQQISNGTFFETTGTHAHTFSFYALLVPFWELSNHSVFVLRVVMIIIGIASIFLFFQLAKQLSNKRTALFMVLLLVFSPFHILYSQLIRPYIFLMLLFSMSLIILNEYCRTKRLHTALVLAIIYIMSFYSLVLSALFIIVQLAYLVFLKLFVQKDIPSKHIFYIAGVVGVACSLWIPFFIEQFKYNIVEGAIVTLSTIKLQYIPYTFYKYAVAFDVSSALALGYWWVLPFALFLVLVAIYGASVLWKESKITSAFILFNLLGPLTLLAFLGIFFPVYSFRYISYLSPLFFFLLAKGFDTIKNPLIRWGLILLTIVLYIIILHYYWSIFTLPKWDIHFGA